jgi:hypothetical protein
MTNLVAREKGASNHAPRVFLLYRALIFNRMEPTIGLEPMTCRLRIGCSTN